MNNCFIIGKIISKIKYDFILNSKNNSIIQFNIELENKSIIKIIGYDEIADYCYWKLEDNNIVFIYGKINSNMEIQINNIYII